MKPQLTLILLTAALLAACASPTHRADPAASTAAKNSETTETLPAEKAETPRFERPELREELLEMAKRDQSIRKRVLKSGSVQNPPKELAAQVNAVDAKNTTRLKEMIDELGRWPGITLVGPKGANAAWLIAQHADKHPDLQHFFLEKLEVAVQNKQAPPTHFAYLLDRVRLKEGKSQVYGTQFDLKDGKLVMSPVADPDELDARRKEIGLEPIDEYEAKLRKMYSVQKPADK